MGYDKYETEWRKAAFAKNVRQLLIDHGLSLQQASQRWGIPCKLLQRWSTEGVAYANKRAIGHIEQLAALAGDLWKQETRLEKLISQLDGYLLNAKPEERAKAIDRLRGMLKTHTVDYLQSLERRQNELGLDEDEDDDEELTYS